MVDLVHNVDRNVRVIGENPNPMCVKSDQHGHVEDGGMYYISDEASGAGVLSNGSQRTYLLRVGDEDIHAIETHMDFVAGITSGYLACRIYENQAVSAPGNVLTMRNRNRNYPDDPPTGPKIFLEPTLSGALLEANRLDTLPVTATTLSGPRDPDKVENILKKHTDYIIQFDNQLGSSISWLVSKIGLYPETVPPKMDHNSLSSWENQ